MRFSVELPTQRVASGAEFVSAQAVGEVARAAEAAGFSAVFVTDHPFPNKQWLDAGGHHTLDPFVALSFAAAATERLRVQTHVLVLPYRNPFLVAKQAASLDVLSNGRMILGVAAGYLRPEFEALGADYDARNDSGDEAVDAIKRAWSGEAVTMSGHGYTAAANLMLPRPVQRPRPPIWVGGNSKRAIRRAVERADGWVPFRNPPELAVFSKSAVIVTTEDLKRRIDYAREHAAAIGRSEPLEICYSMVTRRDAPTDEVLRAIEEYAELGVGWLTVGVAGKTRAQYCEGLARFGEEIIAAAGGVRESRPAG